MPKREQKFTKTPFKKQAEVLSSLLRTNPMINDDDKVSMNETVGVLTWLNQLQLFCAPKGVESLFSGDPKYDTVKMTIDHIFGGRIPEKAQLPAD